MKRVLFCMNLRYIISHSPKFYLFGKALSISSRFHRLGSVMVSVLASSLIVGVFDPHRVETKDYQDGMHCFNTKHATLISKSKYLLLWNDDNVFDCRYMSTCELLFHGAKFQLRILV